MFLLVSQWSVVRALLKLSSSQSVSHFWGICRVQQGDPVPDPGIWCGGQQNPGLIERTWINKTPRAVAVESSLVSERKLRMAQRRSGVTPRPRENDLVWRLVVPVVVYLVY